MARASERHDPSFDVLEYAAAREMVTLRSTGWIKAGVRVTDSRYDPPGTLASASDVLPRCHVCDVIIEPDKDGEIRQEMVEHDGRIVRGPVWVQAECRTGVSTRTTTSWAMASPLPGPRQDLTAHTQEPEPLSPGRGSRVCAVRS